MKRNLLDSSGWIEVLADAPNADHFAPVLEEPDTLIVPTIVLHEVYRWAHRVGGAAIAERTVAGMQVGRVVPLDADLAVESARLARTQGLPTADSIIYATALAHGATVWTQDDDFEALPDVRYFAKQRTASR